MICLYVRYMYVVIQLGTYELCAAFCMWKGAFTSCPSLHRYQIYILSSQILVGW